MPQTTAPNKIHYESSEIYKVKSINEKTTSIQAKNSKKINNSTREFATNA